MSDADEPGSRSSRKLRSLLVDITPLRESPAFARLWIGTSVAQIGAQVTIVAVGLHVYALTHSTLAVSMVAVWALGPMILAGLFGGALADRYDRRLVALVTAIIAWICIGALTTIAFLDVETLWLYYALAAGNAAAATIMGAARGAILPKLLPNHLLPAAAALGGITMGLAVTVGPAVAGITVAAWGYPWTYLLDAVLFTAAFVGIFGLPQLRPDVAVTGFGLSSVADSLRFLRRAPNIRATFVFDLVAMIFGTPRVVYPAAGAVLLGGGSVTVGALTASFAVGALLSGLLSGPFGQVRRQGRAVTLAILAFGASTALFGVVLLVTSITHGTEPGRGPIVPAIVLGGIALAGAGASDNVSAVFRTTILQAAAPDEVRGRMQGLFSVVVAGGPRVGDLVAGLIATALALWAPALVGGLVIMAIMLAFLRVYRGFQQYDAVHPTP